jgi:hypothetical protein
MQAPSFASLLSGPLGTVFLASALLGGLFGGTLGALLAYLFSRRLFKSEVMRDALRDIRAPLAAYGEWLTTVSGEFSLWKADLLPAFLPDSERDQFELNRMRKLFVDQRSQRWLDKWEEYDSLLAKFGRAAQAIRLRQAGLHQAFAEVFRNLESDPPEAARAGGRIENLAFEQIQLVSDFLYHLQYECLRPIATARPRAPNSIAKPRIVRTAFGKIKVIAPEGPRI